MKICPRRDEKADGPLKENEAENEPREFKMPLPPLRPEQAAAVADAVAWYGTAKPGSKRVYTSPTGTGKSVVQLSLKEAVPGSVIVTPKNEIADDMATKIGATDPETFGIWTPVSFRNRLLHGQAKAPSLLIIDEVHFHDAEVRDHIFALCGEVPTIGFTATDYQGSPKRTAAFRKVWGESIPIITLAEAQAKGYWALPTCSVWPLIDDDLIKVNGGDFVIEDADKAVGSVIAEVVEKSRQFCVNGTWDRPTIYSVPGVKSAHRLADAMWEADLPVGVITGETPPTVRIGLMDASVEGQFALIQINVVSIGVDRPWRRLIDLNPRISPAAWMQQVGRITRPVPSAEDAPEYICCNRNLLRHAYLLGGMVPASTVRTAQEAFGGKPSSRIGHRVMEFETLGKFRPTELPCQGGLKGVMYAFSAVEGTTVTQYAALVHPLLTEVVWATRSNVRRDGFTATYGRWYRCEAPDGVEGFASLPAGKLSDAQKAWWRRSAARYGLDDAVEPNARQFAALPILSDLSIRFTY